MYESVETWKIYIATLCCARPRKVEEPNSKELDGEVKRQLFTEFMNGNDEYFVYLFIFISLFRCFGCWLLMHVSHLVANGR